MNLLAAKIYYDGSHWIAIPHTERPYRQRRRRKQPEKSEELQQFEERFEKVKGGRKSRKAKLLQEFTPMFKDENEAEQFVEEHFNRLSRNRWERYKRMIRRGYTNSWNFFCTYTFDSKKHTEATFRTSLMNTLYHFSARRDWRYMGAWERGELGERLHFHALTYIPEGQMPGELEEHEDYSTKRHRREKSIQNSFFNERFGRSDFSAVNNAYEVADSIKYMLKYISKNDEKIVYSRGLKTRLTETTNTIQSADEFIQNIKKYLEAPELTREMCYELLDRVVVGGHPKHTGKERVIDIVYKVDIASVLRYKFNK